MRQETNNEMDLLLRRLARQQETSASGDHLDADELNSYAENVLPPAARARYSEHLAECARCRDLVVQLSSSAGVVVAPETVKVSAPSALKKFLTSLFSPMVLRYAVPALGLIVVAAIGFMVSRREGNSNSPVADVRYTQPDQGLVASQPQQPSVSPEKQSSAFVDRGEPANKAATAHDSAAPSATPVPNAPPVSPVTTDAPKDTEAQAKKVDEEREQPEAKEAEPPKAAAPVSELKKLEPQGRTQQAAEQTVTVRNDPAAEKAKTENRGVGDFAVASPIARKRAETGSTGGMAAAKPMAAQRDDAADNDKNQAETRTVAGRRFRKQDNVWIDTAYNSQSLTELRRGSEQYRGLVGDEPGIKQIADQLDGEVIVIWKGKAYKIR